MKKPIIYLDADFEDTAENVEAALRQVLQLGDRESLGAPVTAGQRQFRITYNVVERVDSLPDVAGMTVDVRRSRIRAKVIVPNAIQREPLILQRIRTAVNDVAEQVAKQSAGTPTPRYSYTATAINGDFVIAAEEDLTSGAMPMTFDTIPALGQNSKLTLFRKAGGVELGTLEVRSFLDDGGVVVKLHLHSATEPEAIYMVRALRSWLRGRALNDNAPLPTIE